MKEIKLVIGSYDLDYIELLAKDIANKPEKITVVGTTDDGLELIRLVSKLRPNVIILDPIMKNLDGFDVMKKLHGVSNIPVIIATPYLNPQLVEEAYALGAAYILLQPFTVDALLGRVIACCDPPTVKIDVYDIREVHNRASEVLLELGVPAYLMGYRYLRDAIIMVFKNENLGNSLTKELYPEVGKANLTTPSRVERACRHAIESAWDRGDIDFLTDYFKNTVDAAKGKPTNGEFICLIADKLRREMRLQPI